MGAWWTRGALGWAMVVSAAALGLTALTAGARSAAVTVEKTADGYRLVRDGQPYFIQGAGGGGSKELLRACGGNSFRTWGADNLDGQLAEAQKRGLTVTVGIWLGHKDQGFDYHDPKQVAAQYESARRAVLRYRASPALLLWSIGNEMEVGQQDDPAVWEAVEQIAAMVKKLDPSHPTMTVVAEIGGDKVAQINRRCPDIDIIGINSYGGAPSLARRYKEAGGVKPYIVTEFGPPGVWELPKNAWGVAREPTSTEKAGVYRKAYEAAVAHQPLCLGSYAFTWGNKREATDTWFGMLLPDGSRLAAADAMSEMWTGRPPAHPCPVLHSLTVSGPDQVAPGATVDATLDASGAPGDTLTAAWVLQADPATYHADGRAEVAPPTYPDAFVRADLRGARVKMPAAPGAYRLYAYVRDTYGGAATANVPLRVVAGDSAPAPPPG